MRNNPEDPTGVLIGWALAFGALGAWEGALRAVLGEPGALGVYTASGGVLGLAAGGAAVAVERRRARARPGVLGADGREIRPLAGWLSAVPALVLALAAPGFGMAASLRTHTATPFVISAFVSVFVLWSQRRTWSRERLRQALALGAPDALAALARDPMAAPEVRAHAALLRGESALLAGAPEEAAGWFGIAAAGPSPDTARLRLALAEALAGRPDVAAATLTRVEAGKPGRAITRARIAEVRCLILWRTEGPAVATRFAETWLSEKPGLLLVGLAAAGRLRADDVDGAMALLDSGVRERLIEAGLGRAIPELRDVLGAP